MWVGRLITAVAVAVSLLVPAGGLAALSGGDEPVSVLVYSAVYGFRHDSIAPLEQQLLALDDGGEFRVAATSNPADLNAGTLADTDVLVFNNSCGYQPWSERQRVELLDWVAGGGGMVGIHCADDANYDWAPYGRLLGAVFLDHPLTGEAVNIVEEPDHPLVGHLPEEFTLHEEYRLYQQNPRGNVRMLTSLDLGSMGTTQAAQYADDPYPQTWCTEVYGGRTFTTGWGHFTETFEQPELWEMLVQALRWTGGRIDADCTPDNPVPEGRLEAEFADTVAGGQVSTHTADGGQATVSHLIHGDFLHFADVDLTGVEELAVNVSPETPTQPSTFREQEVLPAIGGTIEVFVGDPFPVEGCPLAGPCTREPEATIDVPFDLPGWSELTVALDDVDGVHDLHLVVQEPLGEGYQFGRIFAPEPSDHLYTMSIDWAELR